MTAKRVDGYTQPVEPGSYLMYWGEPGAEHSMGPEHVTVQQMGDGQMRVTVRNTRTLLKSGHQVTAVAWLQRHTCTGDALTDYVHVINDKEFETASNGYYVEVGHDPDGARGTGYNDPETGEPMGEPSMVLWRDVEYDMMIA